jgi:hypothetical protein
MQAAEGDLQRLARKDQRQEGKHVRQALTGPVADERVERRRIDETVEQTLAFPDRPADRHLIEHDLKDALSIDGDARVPVNDFGK